MTTVGNQQLRVRLSTDRLERLDEVAETYGATRSDVIKALIDEYLDRLSAAQVTRDTTGLRRGE